MDFVSAAAAANFFLAFFFLQFGVKIEKLIHVFITITAPGYHFAWYSAFLDACMTISDYFKIRTNLNITGIENARNDNQKLCEHMVNQTVWIAFEKHHFSLGITERLQRSDRIIKLDVDNSNPAESCIRKLETATNKTTHQKQQRRRRRRTNEKKTSKNFYKRAEAIKTR